MTETIRNTKDLRRGYSWLRLLQEHVGEFDDQRIIRELIRDQKQAIRKYYRDREAKLGGDETVLDCDFDRCIRHFPLPSGIQTREQAREYFEECEHIRFKPCAWDCSGQAFTAWFKLHRKPDGRWWCYHCICLDV